MHICVLVEAASIDSNNLCKIKAKYVLFTVQFPCKWANWQLDVTLWHLKHALLWVWSHPWRTHLGILSICSWDKRLPGCLHLQWVISPPSINNIQPTSMRPHRASRRTIIYFFGVKTQNITGPSGSWCKHFCSKNRSCCCCRPLFSNPLLQFSQCKLHLFLRCRLIAFALPCIAAVLFSHKLDTPKNDSAWRQ